MKKLIILLALLLIAGSCLKGPDYHIDISYTGEELDVVEFPMGGLGSGNFSIEGSAALTLYEIFDRHAVNQQLPQLFFSIYSKKEGEEAVGRILEREPLNEEEDSSGRYSKNLSGLPRFKEAVFHNAFPFYRIDLLDEEFPLDVQMISWSPFIPLDIDDSGLPAVMTEWKIANTNRVDLEYSLALSLLNPRYDNNSDYRDQILIRSINSNNWKGFEYYNQVKDSLKRAEGMLRFSMPDYGELITDHTFPFDSMQGIEAAMFFKGKLQPGEEVILPFIISWYKPEIQSSDPYTALFPGIDSVTSYIISNYESIRTRTRQFSGALTTSSVPPSVLEAVLNGLAALRSKSSFYNKQDDLDALTLLKDDDQVLASLFPSLARKARDNEFRKSGEDPVLKGGDYVNRLDSLRLSMEKRLGSIVRTYREWKISGNSEWLGELWPGIKQAMELAHGNTSEWLSLAALNACSEMALAMNEPQKSLRYKDRFYNARDTQPYRSDGYYLAFISGMEDLMDSSGASAVLGRYFDSIGGTELEELSLERPPEAAGYRLAASLIHAGYKDEGLALVEAMRQQSALVLSSWSVYMALSGFSIDAYRGRMQFDPAIDILPCRYFWSTASGWGTFNASRASVELQCLSGSLQIEELLLKGRSFFVLREFIPSENCEVYYENESLMITFPGSIELSEGQSFTMLLP